MQQLGEFTVGDFAGLVFAKVQLDKVAVEVERNLAVEGGVLDDVLKLVCNQVQATAYIYIITYCWTTANYAKASTVLVLVMLLTASS